MISFSYSRNEYGDVGFFEIHGTPAELEAHARELRARADACMAAAYYGPGSEHQDGFGVTVFCRAPRAKKEPVR